MTFRDVMLILVVLTLLGVAVVILTPAWNNVRDLQDEVHLLQARHEEQKTEIEQIRREVDELRSGNPQAVERVAREKFGYCRPGEEVYQFEGE